MDDDDDMDEERERGGWSVGVGGVDDESWPCRFGRAVRLVKREGVIVGAYAERLDRDDVERLRRKLRDSPSTNSWTGGLGVDLGLEQNDDEAEREREREREAEREGGMGEERADSKTSK